MSPNDDLIAIQGLHDQDEARAMKWWLETSDAAKKELWIEIQEMGGSPIRELISRFAQFGYTEIFLRAERRKP